MSYYYAKRNYPRIIEGMPRKKARGFGIRGGCGGGRRRRRRV